MAERTAYRVTELKGTTINRTGRNIVVRGDIEYKEGGVKKTIPFNPDYQPGDPVELGDIKITSPETGETVFQIKNPKRGEYCDDFIPSKEEGIYYLVTKEVADTFFRRDDFIFVDFNTGHLYSYFLQ